MADNLGLIGMSTGPGLGFSGGLGQVVATGTISSPITYGTIIRFPGYYNIYLCASYDGKDLYFSGDLNSGSMDNLVWHKVAME